MKAVLCRVAALGALLLSCLPVMAQRVRYDGNGQADVVAVNFDVVQAAVIRDVTGLAPESRGQVVFFRSQRGAADADAIRVQENGADLHPLPAGGWFVAVVPPGPHHYGVDGQAVDLQVEAGRCYYLRASGAGDAARLSPSNAMVFLKAAGSRPLPRL